MHATLRYRWFIEGNILSGYIGFLCHVTYISYDSTDFPDTDCVTPQDSIMSILYDGLGATNYNMRRNNACEWVGVGCDSDDNVIDINLGKVKSSIDFVISEVSDQTYTFIFVLNC